MNILVIGNGGREHALAWKAAQSKHVDTVFVAPGNAGTEQEPGLENVSVAADDLTGLLSFAKNNNVALTIVGPEIPLVLGIVDEFQAQGLAIFGPSKAAARLEGSKVFSKDFLKRHHIPTAEYASFSDIDEAINYLQLCAMPIVIKADGLAAGKGVIIAEDLQQAKDAVTSMLADNQFGDAGSTVVIEGVVVGDFQNNASADNGDLNGFYVQEEDADADADPATSEGIFVFGSVPEDVVVGDFVRVQGDVVEFAAPGGNKTYEVISIKYI